jgi:uncharacterized membrane protein
MLRNGITDSPLVIWTDPSVDKAIMGERRTNRLKFFASLRVESVKPPSRKRIVLLNGQVPTRTTSKEHPMVQIIETIDVDVPVRTAYDQWTQFETFPKFLDEVESITQLDDKHTHWKVKVGPVEREFDAEITEQHPDERVAWNSIGGDTEHAGVVTFHKLTDTSSRVTVQLDWAPEGLLEKVGALVGAGSHAVKKDLKNFKEFIEAQGVETGAWRGDVPA